MARKRRQDRTWWYGLAYLVAPLVMVIAVGLIAVHGDALSRCFGHPVNVEYHGRASSVPGMVASVVCSPYLLKGTLYEMVLFVLLWAPLPFAFLGHRWQKHDEASRAERRERDRQRRAEKRAAKLAQAKFDDS